MKGFKKGCVALLVAVLTALVVLPASPALAITENQRYEFYFSGTGATQGTYGYRKDNNTECFIAIESLGSSRLNFYIDGSTSSSGPWYNRTGVNGGGVAVASTTGYFLIHNNVYETGCRYARLTAMSPSGRSSAYGYWSPDTNQSGWWPYLN